MRGVLNSRWLRPFVLLGLVVVLILSFSPVQKTQAAGGSFTEYYYGSNFYYKVYVPSGYVAGTKVPMMVMLHGCVQNPDDFAAGTQMNALAEQKNFIVLYPEMNVYANSSMCWNWFYDYNQHRNAAGEADIIKGMVDDVKGSYAIDSNKVYVAGLSAGAAMATIMGATYPDVFHGVGVSAGVEYNAADDAYSASSAMSYGSYDPNQAGKDAYTEMGSYKRKMPVIVFQGTGDTTVAPVNGTQVVQSWLQTNDMVDDGSDNNSVKTTAAQTLTGSVTGGRSYTHYIYNDNAGKSLVEYYTVNGMDHAWSGGSSSGSYTDPSGPNATQIMWNFFTSH
jgi:poly(hydroxyalkanoate) depolymerase family esterase